MVTLPVEWSVDAALEEIAEPIDDWDDLWTGEEKDAATREIRGNWNDGQEVEA